MRKPNSVYSTHFIVLQAFQVGPGGGRAPCLRPHPPIERALGSSSKSNEVYLQDVRGVPDVQTFLSWIHPDMKERYETQLHDIGQKSVDVIQNEQKIPPFFGEPDTQIGSFFDWSIVTQISVFPHWVL